MHRDSPHQRDNGLRPAQPASRRIGFDISILDRSQSGTSVYARNLLEALGSTRPDGFEIVTLRAPKPLSHKNMLAKFFNFLLEITWLTLLLPLRARMKKIDLLHMPANAISPLVRIPQVCSIHDAHFITTPEGRDPLWRLYANWYFRYAARHATRILCDTYSAKEEIVDLLGAEPDRIEVINLGLTERRAGPEDIRAAEGLKPYILSVSATIPNKNFPSLVKAFSLLRKAGKLDGYHLVIAGPPGRDHARITQTIEQEGQSDSVILAGKVTDSYLEALYENCDLFAFPSLAEGFGFPPLEAMKAGAPVAASNAPCIPETLADAAVYFDPQDIDGIAGVIEEVLTDAQLRDRLAQAGKDRAAGFTWRETAIRTWKAYSSVLGSR